MPPVRTLGWCCAAPTSPGEGAGLDPQLSCSSCCLPRLGNGVDGWVRAQAQPSSGRGRQGCASFGPFCPQSESDPDLVANHLCLLEQWRCLVAVSQQTFLSKPGVQGSMGLWLGWQCPQGALAAELLCQPGFWLGCPERRCSSAAFTVNYPRVAAAPFHPARAELQAELVLPGPAPHSSCSVPPTIV